MNPLNMTETCAENEEVAAQLAPEQERLAPTTPFAAAASADVSATSNSSSANAAGGSSSSGRSSEIRG